MNLAALLLSEFGVILLSGVIFAGYIEIRLARFSRRFSMTQKEQLDRAIEGFKSQAQNIVNGVETTVSNLNARLTAKNEATQEVDLSAEIAELNAMSDSVLGPLKTFAGALPATTTTRDTQSLSSSVSASSGAAPSDPNSSAGASSSVTDSSLTAPPA